MLLHRFFIQNGQILENDLYKPNTGIEIYEVIRIIKGVPLFLEDHLKRFFHSAWLCHLEIPLDEEMILYRLKELIAANSVEEGNIRFSFCFRPAGNFMAYFIPHRYPDETEIKEGVVCGILHAERSDPNAKVVQANIRESADHLMKENRYFEVLLINKLNQLTEGSRSNLFFIKDETIYTAPQEDILPGITRSKVLELIHNKFMKLSEQSLTLEEARNADAAFLTGTSPKVLPVRKIGDCNYLTDHPMVRGLIIDYDGLIQQYINLKKG